MTCVHAPTHNSAMEHDKDPFLENRSFFTLLFLQPCNNVIGAFNEREILLHTPREER